MTCRERLEAYLRASQVPFEAHPHQPAYTAQAVAEREHIPGQLMVKVVVVVADGELAMLALPTSRRADLARVAELLDAREVRLATEGELSLAFPDCEIGAMPPFGGMYGLPVYVDRSLEGEHRVFFQDGTHTGAMSVSYADFRRLAAPVVAEFTGAHRRPQPHADDIREMGAW